MLTTKLWLGYSMFYCICMLNLLLILSPPLPWHQKQWLCLRNKWFVSLHLLLLSQVEDLRLFLYSDVKVIMESWPSKHTISELQPRHNTLLIWLPWNNNIWIKYIEHRNITHREICTLYICNFMWSF